MRKLALSLLAAAVVAPLAMGISTATAPAARAEANPPRGTDAKPVLMRSAERYIELLTSLEAPPARSKPPAAVNL